MLALDARPDRSDVTVLHLKGETALAVVRSEAEQTPLNRGHGEGRGPVLGFGAVENIKPDHGRGGDQGIDALAPAPAGKVFPIRFVGLVRILGRRGFSVPTRLVDAAVERPGADDMIGQGNALCPAFFLTGRV